MRQILVLLSGLMVSVGAFARSQHWQDPYVNEENRLPMHSSYFAYESHEASEEGMNASGRYLSLNGKWKFNWVCDASQRPEDFHRTDFNDRG